MIMKRLLFLVFVLVSAALLTSACVGNAGQKGLTPSKETVSGPLGSYFKVVDRTYKAKNGIINVEIERIAAGLPSVSEDSVKAAVSDRRVKIGFSVEFLDKDGDVVGKDQTDALDAADIAAINALSVGESATVSFSVSDRSAVSFRIFSTFERNGRTADNLSGALDDASKNLVNACGEAAIGMMDVYGAVANEMKDAMEEAFKDIL